MTEPLPPHLLRARCDPERLGFASTAELEPLGEVLGQARATRAIDFGIGMKAPGYNLFVAGPPGTGKSSTLAAALAEAARAEPTPPDVCYVYRFDDPFRPRALLLPAGRGRALKDAMNKLVDALKARLPRAFEEERFEREEAAIAARFEAGEAEALAGVEALAKKDGFVLRHTDGSVSVEYAPEGQTVDAASLPAEERERLRERAQAIEAALEPAVRTIRALGREVEAGHQALVARTIRELSEEILRDIAERFADVPAVGAQLEELRADLSANAEALRAGPSEDADVDGILERYRVNLLVDRTGLSGAPVVREPNPTYRNLVGRFEHRVEQGALVTSFLLIQAGPLLQANGGYAVLEARDLVDDPMAYLALKRALKGGAIRIEEPVEELQHVSAASLQPDPIPFGAKLVLLGTPETYATLYDSDDDFRELFKVKVEFEESLPRTPETVRAFARFLAGAIAERGLRPLSAAAVARLVEEGSRQVAHQGRISARFGEVVDLLCEADFFATRRGAKTTDAEDLSRALAERRERQSALEEQLARLTEEEQLVVETQGSVIGQVNGVAVLSTGGHQFGRPQRITARAWPSAHAGVVDVEREVGLAGPIHSKGIMVLTGYLGGRYAPDRPLSMMTSIVAEQSYDFVEGDSASLAELCALLSAIARAPIRQSIAVTGSLDQRGRVRAVGGVNHKIEGFFGLCRARGHLEDAAVIIPRSSVHGLMLREPLEGLRVYAVESVDEAMELLTGRVAGERDARGRFPDGSLNAEIERVLLGWSASSLARGAG